MQTTLDVVDGLDDHCAPGQLGTHGDRAAHVVGAEQPLLHTGDHEQPCPVRPGCPAGGVDDGLGQQQPSRLASGLHQALGQATRLSDPDVEPDRRDHEVPGVEPVRDQDVPVRILEPAQPAELGGGEVGQHGAGAGVQHRRPHLLGDGQGTRGQHDDARSQDLPPAGADPLGNVSAAHALMRELVAAEDTVLPGYERIDARLEHVARSSGHDLTVTNRALSTASVVPTRPAIP